MGQAARFLKWTSAYPNARLAGLGLVLMYAPVGMFKAIEWLLLKYFTGLESYWNVILWTFWAFGVFVVFPIMLAGMVMIAFAAYRATRDFLRRRRLPLA
jgi:hypothetical protein